jgi:hypothetical protein
MTNAQTMPTTAKVAKVAKVNPGDAYVGKEVSSNAAGNQVMNRRVYREWVDRIIDQLEK